MDRVVATTDTREIRRRLLPARLVMYSVLALGLFRGPNCGYGRVMVKLLDALYHPRHHPRRGQQLLDGPRPGRLGPRLHRSRLPRGGVKVGLTVERRTSD